MSELTSEKLAQAVDRVRGAGVDVWLTFVRETSGGGDPVLPLILESQLTWESALLVGRDGRKVAVVGNYDADPLKASGDWDEVVPYVQGIGEPLLAALRQFVPASAEATIAVNYSRDDPKADGLTHGMFLQLEEYLRGTEFEGRLVSAEEIVVALRGRKTAEELARIRQAVEGTTRLLAEVPSLARVGASEREVYDRLQRRVEEEGLAFAWDRAGCPIVSTGPDSMVGHGIPSATLRLAPGHVFHIDFGVAVGGYCADMQRCWYVPETGETAPPADVTAALAAVNGAISAGAEALRPGVAGWEVDAAARRCIQEAGYPEYLHALGHQVGRAAHDGGGILGPRWERYGRTPFVPVEEGQVYTLELGVIVPGRGYLGIEEMVVVTRDGCDWLSGRQLELPVLRGASEDRSRPLIG